MEIVNYRLVTEKKIYKIICMLLTVCFIIGLVGCNNPKESDEVYYTFTDDSGAKVSLEKKPERVAALIGSFADVWCLSGGELVAAADDAWEDFSLETDAVNIGGAHSPSFEKLLSADPDFVIASASTASNVEMKTALSDAGIKVAYFDVDNFEDYLNMLRICTDITGRKDLYEQNGLKVSEKIEEIKTNFSSKNIPENERTVLLLRASSGFVKAKNSKGTVLGEMLDSLGLINIADSDKSLLENLSIESIIKNEPYHIFVVTMGDDVLAAKGTLDKMMKENSAWGELSAVKEDRMHIMDRKLFNLKPNNKWAVAYEKLCEIFG